MTMSVNSESTNNHTMEVFFGEHIVSLRDLFRRYTYSVPWKFLGTSNGYNTTYLFTKVFPYYRGTMPTGVNGVYSYQGTGLETYDITPCCTIPLTYCAPAYMAWRGGIRKKLINNATPILPSSVHGVTRKPFTTTAPGWRNEVYENPVDVLRLSDMARDSFAGQEFTMVRNTGMIEVEFPYYQRERFSSPRIYKPREIQSDSYEYTVINSNAGSTITQDQFVHEYVSTAEDFTLIYFINVPTMYRYEFPAQQAP